MAQIKGTNVASPVVPFDTADQNPSHEARYGKGGYRTVATTTERDAIPAPRREAGMLVYVAAGGGSLWQLGADLTTWTAFETGGGDPNAHAATHGEGGTDPVTIAGSQISGGALPANATLTFSDGTADAEIGGWGFGVELTADGSVYSTVEPSAVTVHGSAGYAALQSQSVYFGNGTSLAVGTFDSGRSGYNGISLVCAVGYELNWQAGYLKCINANGTTRNIWVESPLEFPGNGTDNVQIDATGITFADGSTQTAAWTGTSTFAQVADTLTYTNFLTEEGGGSLADALSDIDTAISGKATAPSDDYENPALIADGAAALWDFQGGTPWVTASDGVVLFGTGYAGAMLTAIGAAAASHTHSAADITSGTIAVANGGTGASTASAARTNLSAQKTITSGTAVPTGGADGDIYLQYT